MKIVTKLAEKKKLVEALYKEDGKWFLELKEDCVFDDNSECGIIVEETKKAAMDYLKTFDIILN